MKFSTSPSWTVDASEVASCDSDAAGSSAEPRQGFFSLARMEGGGKGPVWQRQQLQAIYTLAEGTPNRRPKPERGLRVVKIKPDGKCMFRALARGMSHGQGVHLREADETRDADLLRAAVAEALCQSPEVRKPYAEVAYSVEHVEGGFDSYCTRLKDPGFWGGEAELVVLSRLLAVPINVYKTAEEAGGRGWGFVKIVDLGQEAAAGRKPVKLLYVNGNHYDLLL